MRSYLKTFANRETFRQFLRMGAIGIFNTVFYFALFNVFRAVEVSIFWSVTLGSIIATFVSYLLNRHWAFELRGGAMMSMRETFDFFWINAVAWAIMTATVLGADRLFGPLTRFEENVANFAAAVIILIPKFASYRDIVFGRALAHKKSHAGENEVADGERPTPLDEAAASSIPPEGG